MLEIDGSAGEGGGQLVRCAVALAAITGTAIRIVRARAHRDPPGLAAQHLTAVEGVAALCDASTPGLALHARRFEFVPSRLRGGRFTIDVGTAGSVPLVLQATIPVALAAPEPVELVVTGGTDVHGAPAYDYTAQVWQWWLTRMGLDVTLSANRRGYYPRGGGVVGARVRPGEARPLSLVRRGPVRALGGIAHTSNLPAHVVDRMADRCVQRLERFGPVRIERAMCGPGQAVGTGGAIAVWADCAGVRVGASAVARRGVPAEAVADEAVASLIRDLEAGATLDRYASDQLPIYLARAKGPSEYLVRRETRHARTIIDLLRRFLPVGWDIRPTAGGAYRCRIESG